MDSKPIINIYGNVSLKNVKKGMLKSYDVKSIKYIKYKYLYNDNFTKYFNQWYNEDLKYIILKMNKDKMYKIQAMIKSLIYDTFNYKNDVIVPKLKFIILSKKSLIMDISLKIRCEEIHI